MEAPTTHLASVQRDPDIRLHGLALALVLGSLLLTNFLAGLDQIIVDTALPRIISDLRGFDRYTWVITAYLLAFTAIVPIVGKLSDQFGCKWLLMGSIVIFLFSSALAGASSTMDQLILFRGLQGLSAGAMQTLVSITVADLFAPAQRARWQGLFIGVFALASVVGPLAGGWLTDHLGWRWVFYVNVPLVPLALIALFLLLPTSLAGASGAHRGWAVIRRIDFVGALSMAAATICLLLGLTWGGQRYAWNSAEEIGILAAAGILFLIFLINERFAKEPILPLHLARNQVFAAGALLSLTMNMALLAMLVFVPLYLQGILGQTATNSGAFTTPLTVTIMVSAIINGFLVSKVGQYQLSVVLGTLTTLGGAFLMTQLSPATSPLTLTRNMIVIGIGVGISLPVLTIAVQSAVPREDLGAGTGAMTYLRSLGSSLAVALMGAVVNDTYASELPSHLPPGAGALPPSLLSAATSQQVLLSADYRHALQSQLPHELFQQLIEATRQTLATSVGHAFWVALGICALSLFITFFLKDVPLRGRESGR